MMGRINQFVTYLRETRAEVDKVVWPSRRDTLNTTVVVFGMVFAVSIFLWIFDTIISSLVQLLYSLMQ
ncbi:MAG: preprotein translocase subunit SecE [Magnetococcus sp. WYHC-3]